MLNEFKIGQKVKVIGNTSGHNHPIGSVKEVTAVSVPNGTLTLKGHSNYLYFADVAPYAVSLADLQEAEKELEKSLEGVREKIALLNELGETEIDEDTIKCYNVLKTVNSADSDFEKAKKIVALLK